MKESDQGSALALVLVITAASLLTLTMFLSLISDLRDDSILTRRKLVLARVQDEIADLLSHDSSWQAIINPSGANASFACLKNPNLACPPGGSDLPDYIPFQLMQADGQAAFPPPSQGPGFTEQGEACSGATTTLGAGNDSCPFAILARWKRDCGPIVPCQSPYADVRINFVYNPGTTQPSVAVNTERFALQTINSPYSGNVLAQGRIELTTPAFSLGYGPQKLNPGSAHFGEVESSFSLYLPPVINSATLHANLSGMASLSAGASGPTLVGAGIRYFSFLSYLCLAFESLTSDCFTNNSAAVVRDDSTMVYYTPANQPTPITGTTVLVRAIAGQITPYTIRSLFRVEAKVGSAYPVTPQLQRILISYTVYR